VGKGNKKPKTPPVFCRYCFKPASLVTGAKIYAGGENSPWAHKKFWFCPCRPGGSWVGCHSNSRRDIPMGHLADAELRAIRQIAHLYFDTLWKRKKEQGGPNNARKLAYSWIAGMLGIEVSRCHMGEFDIERCEKVIGHAKPFALKLDDSLQAQEDRLRRKIAQLKETQPGQAPELEEPGAVEAA
jgi:hypothetical protein